MHLAGLAVVLLALWGAGDALMRRLWTGAPDTPGRDDPWLRMALSAATGLGLAIVALQALGIAGLLRPPGTLALLALGLTLALWRLPAQWRRLRALPPGPPLSRAERMATMVAIGAFVISLFEPMAPPHAFDEMMYHLPYARQVAESGALGIHDWLRYPWFPYNYDLLYAAALPLAGDVFPHLLHALGGWLAAALVWRLAVTHTDRVCAAIALAAWLMMGEFFNALIDMGVALFVVAAFTVLWLWWSTPASAAGGRRPARWLGLAAFYLGVAAGSKYQALTFLPLVAVCVVWRERRPGPWLLALACFLLPCIYWFGRNWAQTGDPFNPIGAKVFGFTNWNADDYKRQVDDVRLHASLPNVMLWPALLVPFSLAWKTRPAVRAAALFGAWSLLVWLATSRYPRYMMASFPLLAWLGAIGWQQLWRWTAAALARRGGERLQARVSRGLGAALVAVLALAGVLRLGKHVQQIAPTPETREAYLAAHVPGYEVLRWLRANPQSGRLYQVGLSDAIYFAPNPVWGDVFGPYRYADFLLLPPPEMARKFAQHGFGTIVVQTAVGPYLTAVPGFERHFQLLVQKDGVKAYRIVPDAP